jgi:hypothetical protein
MAGLVWGGRRPGRAGVWGCLQGRPACTPCPRRRRHRRRGRRRRRWPRWPPGSPRYNSYTQPVLQATRLGDRLAGATAAGDGGQLRDGPAATCRRTGRSPRARPGATGPMVMPPPARPPRGQEGGQRAGEQGPLVQPGQVAAADADVRAQAAARPLTKAESSATPTAPQSAFGYQVRRFRQAAAVPWVMVVAVTDGPRLSLAGRAGMHWRLPQHHNAGRRAGWATRPVWAVG